MGAQTLVLIKSGGFGPQRLLSEILKNVFTLISCILIKLISFKVSLLNFGIYSRSELPKLYSRSELPKSNFLDMNMNMQILSQHLLRIENVGAYKSICVPTCPPPLKIPFLKNVDTFFKCVFNHIHCTTINYLCNFLKWTHHTLPLNTVV